MLAADVGGEVCSVKVIFGAARIGLCADRAKTQRLGDGFGIDDGLLARSRSFPSTRASPSRSLLVAQTIPNPTHHFFGSGRIFHDFSNGDQPALGRMVPPRD